MFKGYTLRDYMITLILAIALTLGVLALTL